MPDSSRHSKVLNVIRVSSGNSLEVFGSLSRYERATGAGQPFVEWLAPEALNATIYKENTVFDEEKRI
jgi:hypothetical protein